jgi:hypothetical protein
LKTTFFETWMASSTKWSDMICLLLKLLSNFVRIADTSYIILSLVL